MNFLELDGEYINLDNVNKIGCGSVGPKDWDYKIYISFSNGDKEEAECDRNTFDKLKKEMEKHLIFTF